MQGVAMNGVDLGGDEDGINVIKTYCTKILKELIKI